MKIVIDYYIPKKKEGDRSHRFEVWNHGKIDLAVESDSLLPILSVTLHQVGIDINELVAHEIAELKNSNNNLESDVEALEKEIRNLSA